jgi:hypothetical protein
MINKKEILWDILVKYDGLKEYVEFCNGISNFIQGKQDGDDIINIFKGLDKIDKEDKEMVDTTIGGHIDSLLFSI